MSNMIKKIKRKNKKKKLYMHRLSMCFVHGPYTADDLCACYDEGGSHENINYDTVFRKTIADSIMKGDLQQMPSACPIHGIYYPDNLCACYDTDGNLKEDWDKSLD